MKKLILMAALLVSFNAVPAHAMSNISEAKLEAISAEVNRAAAGIRGNCLMVAIEKQRRLLKQDIESEVVAFMPWKAQRKFNKKTGKYEKIGHAVLCVGNKCVDNGDLANYVFDRDEIRFHGEILDDYMGKRLAGN